MKQSVSGQQAAVVRLLHSVPGRRVRVLSRICLAWLVHSDPVHSLHHYFHFFTVVFGNNKFALNALKLACTFPFGMRVLPPRAMAPTLLSILFSLHSDGLSLFCTHYGKTCVFECSLIIGASVRFFNHSFLLLLLLSSATFASNISFHTPFHY